MTKHRKPPRRRWRLWRRTARYWLNRTRAKLRALHEAGTQRSARASWNWTDGENLRPAVQPLRFNSYIAPEDEARFEASLGGYEFWWTMLPDPTADHRTIAYQVAEENFGFFVWSLPVDYVRATNDKAALYLPQPITE